MRIYMKKGERGKESKKNDKKCEVFFIVSGKALYLQSENKFRGNKLLNIKYL